MATTESRPGFRLPWTTHGTAAEADAAPPGSDAVDRAGGDAAEASAPPAAADSSVDGEPTPPVAEANGPVDAAKGEPPAAVPASDSSPDPAPPDALGPSQEPTRGERRRSNPFLAELARAMHAAALEARERVLEQFRAESKAFIEELHARSAEEMAALRRAADEDVAAIRDWSKAEIARIREETERRIAERKAALEEEIEAQAARIEGQIERLQGAVGRFEAEMDRFFEGLLDVEDPTEFAALAANLPEPPPFDEILAAPSASAPSAEPTGAETRQPPEAPGQALIEVGHAVAGPGDTSDEAAGVVVAPEAAGSPEAEPSSAVTAEAEPSSAAPPEGALEPAGAASAPTDDLDSLDDTQIAARLAGLLGTRDEAPVPPSQPVKTQLAVVGLVSVASIAGFKRQLAHLPGVQTVAVASGPNGEFLFAVTHDPDLDLAAIVPGLPGFGARVTGEGPGTLTVTAHDPDLSA